MVTVEQYQEQLRQRRVQVEEAKLRVQQIQIPQPITRELRQPKVVRGKPVSALQQRELLRAKKSKLVEERGRKIALIEGEEVKQVKLEKEFEPIKVQYEEQKARIAAEQKAISDFEKGVKLAQRGKFPFGVENPNILAGFKSGFAEQQAYKKRKEQLETLKLAGVSVKEWTSKDFDPSKLAEGQKQILLGGGYIAPKEEVKVEDISQKITGGITLKSLEKGEIKETGSPVFTQEEASKLTMKERMKLTPYTIVPSKTSKEFGGKVTLSSGEVIYGTKGGGTSFIVDVSKDFQRQVSKEAEPSFLDKVGGTITKVGKGAFGVSVGIAERTIGGWEKILTPPAIATTPYVLKFGEYLGKVPIVSPIELATKRELELSTIGRESQKIGAGVGWVSTRSGMGYEKIATENLGLSKQSIVTKGVKVAGGIAPYALTYAVAPYSMLGTEFISGSTTYAEKDKITNRILTEEWRKYEGELTKPEWIKQMRPQIMKQVSAEGMVTALGAAAFLTLGGAIKGASYLAAEKSVLRGGVSGLENQRAFLEYKGKIYQIKDFTIGKGTSVLEPLVKETTRGWKSLLGFAPESRIISPARPYIKYVWGKGSDFIAQTFKVGKGGVGKIKTTIGGGKIKEVDIIDILTKGTAEEKGMLKTLLGRVYPEGAKVDIFNYGELGKKGVEWTSGMFKKIPTEKIGDWIVYEARQVSKNVNIPSLSKIEETTFANIYKYVPKAEEGVRKIITGGKKSSQEFFQQLYIGGEEAIQTTLTGIKVAVPKIRIPKISVGISSISKQVGDNLPFMVGGTGLKVQDYSSVIGKDYTRITGGQFPGTAPTTSIRNFPREDTTIINVPATILDTKTELCDIYKEKVEVVPRIKTGTTQVSGTRQDQMPIQVPKITPIQIQEPIVTPKTPQRRITIPTQPIITPRIPKIPVPVPSTINILKKTKAKIKTQGLFNVFVRKKGKDVKLYSKIPFQKAKKKLRTELKTTLAASGFITKEESDLEKVRVDLGFEFTPSKKDLLRIVQKRKFRLGTRSEVLGIQRARKKKGRTPRGWF